MSILITRDDVSSNLEECHPTNPYVTRRFWEATLAFGTEVWAMGHYTDDKLDYGCLAEIQKGKLHRQLEIRSTPSLAGDDFWCELGKFCMDQNITELVLGSFGTSPELPTSKLLASSAQEPAIKERTEYWVDLDVEDLKKNMRRSQRTVYKRACDRNLVVVQPDFEEGLRRHEGFTGASLGRRREKGEDIPIFQKNNFTLELLRSGGARLYECRLGDHAVGSVILTVAEKGAHGYSAGFSSEALKLGVGVFLNYTTFEILRDEKMVVFNLGDAQPKSGLATFKKGLGGVPVVSMAGTYDVSSGVRKFAISLQSKFRR
jgi:hypothetical protein